MYVRTWLELVELGASKMEGQLLASGSVLGRRANVIFH